ncbi:hypothetical protein [Rhizosphaericola mali]|uniref:Uncharacterized protein n=1 Tax=Rhizosphaericola mali TaxID=2545455 RepID=A0A5P2G7X1_9BACT|nr:hypothetical protein [Rhizosphaericola mali]QES87621.1 hypothetical protein E0W69_002700 [Rhizosphaericola mali]
MALIQNFTIIYGTRIGKEFYLFEFSYDHKKTNFNIKKLTCRRFQRKSLVEVLEQKNLMKTLDNIKTISITNIKQAVAFINDL